MSTIPTFRAAELACLLLGLGIVGCSSSKPMQTRGDAAAHDVASDVPSDTVSPLAEVATAIDDVAADSYVTKNSDAPADTVLTADVFVPADAPLTKDLLAPDVAGDRAVVEAAADRSDLGGGESGRDGVDAAPAAPDVGKDVAGACTPGMNQTCNDSSLASSVWGTCTADGTCVCNAGYMLNPSTGRCTTALRDAATYGDGPAACTGELEACGCGCCGGTTPMPVCYYPALGETTAIFQAKDEEVRRTSNCATAGCTTGRRYLCCVEGSPEPAGSASYTADGYSGDLDHLGIDKIGTDCAQLSLDGPVGTGSGDDRMALQTNGSWRVVYARVGGCGDAAATYAIRGILGTLVVRKGTLGCVVDVHASLFTFATTGEVTMTRLDADGLPIGGVGDSFCLW